MCSSLRLIPIPDLLADYREPGNGFDPAHPEFGIDAAGRKCFSIDSCIVPALEAVWSANYRTLGCCCGHGQAAGGIITLDTAHGTPTTDTQRSFAHLHSSETNPRRLADHRGSDKQLAALGLFAVLAARPAIGSGRAVLLLDVVALGALAAVVVDVSVRNPGRVPSGNDRHRDVLRRDSPGTVSVLAIPGQAS